MNVSIEEYKTEYFEQVFGLLSSIYCSSITKDVLEDNYIDNNKKIFTAILEGKIVGCAFLEIKEDFIRSYRYGYVTYVAVNSEYRKLGIGRTLFNRLVSVAKDFGCSTLELTSANDRKDAHLFYDALGFTKKKTTIFIKDPL